MAIGLVGGGKAGLEDALDDLLVARGLAGRQQAGFFGALADAFEVEPATIVAHGQAMNAGSGGREGMNRELGGVRLAGGFPNLGGLDAVCHRVADQLYQHIADQIRAAVGEGVESEFIHRELGGLFKVGCGRLDELAKLFRQHRGGRFLWRGAACNIEVVAQLAPQVLQVRKIAAQSGLGDHDREEIVTGECLA